MTEKGTEAVGKAHLTEAVHKPPVTEAVHKPPVTAGVHAGKGGSSAAQEALLRRRGELDSWRRSSQRLRSRNLMTGLAIGAFVVGMFSYTILSVKQERILEEIDDEARIHIIRGPRTGANS